MPFSGFVPRSVLLPAFLAAAMAAALPAQAQTPAGQPPQLAPPKAYKPVAVRLATPYGDSSFVAFRKTLGEIAGKKDRAALAKITAGDFFWIGEKGDKADRKKSGIDNLAAAIELDGKDGAGWEVLKAAADEPTLEEVPERKGIMCSPASPAFDEAAAEAAAKDTGTDASEWGYLTRAGVEARSAAKADAPVTEKLGQSLIRILPDDQPAAVSQQEPSFLRVVTPSGKIGFVADDAVAPLGADQICYAKDAGGWKIAGYAGND